MRLVFDLTFCGDLGNPTFAKSCPSEASRMRCEEFVAAQNLPEAYWGVRGLDVYQWRAGEPSVPSPVRKSPPRSYFWFPALFIGAIALVPIASIIRYGGSELFRQHW